MELQKVLEQRRSIRVYTEGGKPSKEDVVAMVQAAQEAPTWKNTETGRFYAVMDDAKVDEIREKALPGFNQDRSKNAALIVTTYVKDLAGHNQDKVADNEVGNGWGCYDLGLACENLLLKATELGYGTLVMGIRDAEVIRELLAIPEEENIMAVLAVGTAGEAPKRPRRKELDDVLKFF